MQLGKERRSKKAGVGDTRLSGMFPIACQGSLQCSSMHIWRCQLCAILGWAGCRSRVRQPGRASPPPQGYDEALR